LQRALRDTRRAVSQENVKTIREMFAIFNDHGAHAATDAFGHLLAPDFRLDESAELPDPGAYGGKEAFIANLAKLEQAFDDIRIEPLEVEDLGEKVVVVVSIRARGRASSAEVETTFAQLWTLRDGKAVSLRDYATKEEALEAVGLSE
jgi:ketosteroid isomerase-like protein